MIGGMDSGSAPVRRRILLRGTALAAGGAALTGLAGCGADEESTGSGPVRSTTTSTSTEPTTEPSDPPSGPVNGDGKGDGKGDGTLLGPASAVAVGSGKIFAEQSVVVTQPTKGKFRAFTSTCTHMGCPVNKVEGDEIVCPCHGSRYSVTDGSVVAGPAPAALAKRPVEVQDGRIILG